MYCASNDITFADVITFFNVMQIVLSIVALLFGALLYVIPRKMIDLQIALYRPFNWKLEPISMEKEIKNTRILGLILIIFCVISFVLLYLR